MNERKTNLIKTHKENKNAAERERERGKKAQSKSSHAYECKIEPSNRDNHMRESQNNVLWQENENNLTAFQIMKLLFVFCCFPYFKFTCSFHSFVRKFGAQNLLAD